jgi:hypothetical protein
MSKKIYLNIEGIGNEVIEIFSKTTTAEFRSFLCNVADYSDESDLILKLYKYDGTIIPISTEIEPNTEKEPYRLVFRKKKPINQLEISSSCSNVIGPNNEEDDDRLNLNPRISSTSTTPVKTPCPAKTKVENVEMIYRHNIERP